MKMIILFLVSIGACCAEVLGGAGKHRDREVRILPFDKLSVAANVTVILYESSTAKTIIIEGKERFTRRIAIMQKDGRLLITSASHASMKERVTVYVPVNKLRSLEVTDDALVRSRTVLQSPQLDMRSEECCEVYIIVKGVVRVKEGDRFTFVRRIRPDQVAVQLNINTM